MKTYNYPKQMTEDWAFFATQKISFPIPKFIILAVLGGVFIAFGSLLSVIVAGGMPGVGSVNPGLVRFVAGAVFPIGLTMIVITGADLFTSNCASFTFATLQKKAKIATVCKLLALSYLFNFIGTQIIAYFLSSGIGLFANEPWQTYLYQFSVAKVNQDFLTVFIKGVGANWLVCLGVFMAYSAKDIPGKCFSIWIPIMLFVTLGYEHSIANMFFIPAAIYSGADILWSSFILQNLIPATLGNIIGGGVFVGCVYWYLYLREGEKND
jgi:formate/nitrite transporter